MSCAFQLATMEVHATQCYTQMDLKPSLLFSFSWLLLLELIFPSMSGLETDPTKVIQGMLLQLFVMRNKEASAVHLILVISS